MEETLAGTIEAIVYSSEDSGFTVAKLKRSREKEGISIVGCFPALRPGETITCQGRWKHHPSFGRQFCVDAFELSLPTDLKGIERYLESGVAKGIGPTYAKRIVATFGTKTFDILDHHPDRLAEVEGIGEKRIEKIKNSWSEQSSVRKVMVFLRGHNVSLSLAQKIYRRYQEETIFVLQSNPYQLARDIHGVGFKTADLIAQELNIEKDHPMRLKAGIEHLLRVLSEEGHTCFPREELIKNAGTLLEAEEEKIEKELEAIIEEERVLLRSLPIAEEEKPHVWIKNLYLIEQSIAWEIERLRKYKASIREIQMDKGMSWVQEKMHIQFAKEQLLAIERSLQHKIHIITGGPGTGKSTITNAILKLSEKLTSNILLAAPTGRAAKRMSEITKKKAFTIHSLLEMDFIQGGFKRNKENPLVADLIIIDEASMIDTYLMASLLKAIPSNARLLLIGDVDQLPSVGPGNVLSDLILSSSIVTTKLKDIFRQGRNSRIVRNAHRVNQGIFPELTEDESSDFHYIPSENPEEIAKKILELVVESLPQKKGFHPFEEIQVLSPMKRGILGTENLNHLLQEALNPSLTRLSKLGRTFRLGDKVMQIRNNYNKLVFNGDVGRITSIENSIEEIVVMFDGLEVIYDFSEIDELVLAYAVSIHKYQGSECPAIVIPIHTSHFKLLVRNLLYTGVTRGKKLVVLIGSKRAIAIAIKNEEVKKRHTGLLQFLKEIVPQQTTDLIEIEPNEIQMLLPSS